MEYRLLEPVDVLYLRGNRLFGGPGEHAEAQMPPWPSVVAGAIRSRILADRQVDLSRFASGDCDDPEILRVLGTPDRPGSFRLGFLALCRVSGADARCALAPPADLFVKSSEPGRAASSSLLPVPVSTLEGISLSPALSHIPVNSGSLPSKGGDDYWLSEEAFSSYVAGDSIDPCTLVARSELWRHDWRLGIAINHNSRTAEAHQLYTTETVAMTRGVAFLVGVWGAGSLLPADGLVRLGGDGRACTMQVCAPPAQSWRRVPEGDRFRVILLTPGLFPQGWTPANGRCQDGPVIRLDTFEARLLGAAVGRGRVVSGWDAARNRPKNALRTAPAGSVYWFERVKGDMRTLERMLEEGLWPLFDQFEPRDETERSRVSDWLNDTRARRAEGFNNVLLGDWPRQAD
jgi:CRISPR-associated protein Cmr3